MAYLRYFLSWLIVGSPFACFSQTTLSADVLVVGGSASGTTAAIQAARRGIDVLLVEETPWLGGMLTAAGVSATDGNHQLPSGLWGEFRQQLYDHYGGPAAVATGWVSNTQFEPHVGDSLLKRMADREPTLTRRHGYRLVAAMTEDNRMRGAVFANDQRDTLRVRAQVTIDATELGDLMALADVPYYTGEDPRSRTQEALAPEVASDVVQDLTYAAILKNYGEDTTHRLPRPAGYDPTRFDCPCQELCDDPQRPEFSCDQMLDYGRLPNGKYMINWPRRGNDYYVNALKISPTERQAAFDSAKLHTLRFVYYLQHEGGYRNLGLANDEFPTADRMPLIPYHRESRRLAGVQTFTLNELLRPYDYNLYSSAIAVGDYPLDHHKAEGPKPAEIDFPRVPSFAVPYGSLVPRTTDGLLVAEKGISVSHLANGSTRLQPCVMLIGQAAGMAAALCVEAQRTPRTLSVRRLQDELLAVDCWLLPLVDTQPDDWYFTAVQRLGVCGLLKGEGVSVGWANETRIYPDSALTGEVLAGIIAPWATRDAPANVADTSAVTRQQACLLWWQALGSPTVANAKLPYQDVTSGTDLAASLAYLQAQGATKHWAEGNEFAPDAPMLRADMAFVADQTVDVFDRFPVELTAH